MPFDGTTGRPCSTDADCAVPNGPHINRCSNGFTFSVGSVSVQLFTTPVCIPPLSSVVGNCDPAPPSDPQGQLIHFCDGPDTATSPGICVPASNPPTSGAGQCLPQCSFGTDGSAPAGCIGKNACVPVGILPGASTAVGIGYCQGFCATDSDCAALGAGYGCQADIGLCTKTKVARTKQLGAACTVSDTMSGACVCFANPSTSNGYCIAQCLVGSACPGGYVCDDLLPNQIPTASGTVITITKENTGLAGTCVAPCSSSCPNGATCQSITPLGSECIP
jgi:hypothetical protein